MENNAYFGCAIVETVMAWLMGSPKRVSWVGDYAYGCEYTNKAKRESWYRKAGWNLCLMKGGFDGGFQSDGEGNFVL